MGQSVPQSPRPAAGDMMDGAAAAAEQCWWQEPDWRSEGGQWDSSCPKALAVPHHQQGTFTDGCVPTEGLHCLQAMLPQQSLDNDGFALMTNSGSHMLLIILSLVF